MSDPTPEEIDRATRVVTRLSQDDRGKAWAIAVEFARIRAESRKAALDEAAALLVQVRCRVWSPEECALAVRTMDHPPECSCHRWVDCAPRAGGAS